MRQEVTWRVKYQPFENDKWIELPLAASSDTSAIEQFMAWRMLHSVGYHAVMFYRS